MDRSPLATLPVEIRDMIYSHVLIGMDDNHTSEVDPLSYLFGFAARTESGSPSTPKSRNPRRVAIPDIFALTSQSHPLLLTCRQLANEAFETFLRNTAFILNVPTLRFMDVALKCLSLFVSGLGANTRHVTKLGVRVTRAPDGDGGAAATAVKYLGALSGKQSLRPGVLVFQTRHLRARSPFGTGDVENRWFVAEDSITTEIVVGEVAISRRRLRLLKERDRLACEYTTEEALARCKKLEGHSENREAWRKVRRAWWEKEWIGIEDGFEETVATMQVTET